MEDPVIPQHVRKVAIICRTNNLERDKPSDITNVLRCNFDIIESKTNQNNCPCNGILSRSKGSSLRRQKLLQTNIMLKEKCSQVPNFAYLQTESDWVNTNTELEMAYFYKNELIL